jgi:hypothetical protein
LLANDSLAQQEVNGCTEAPFASHENTVLAVAVHDIAYPVALPMQENRSVTDLKPGSVML